MRNVDIWKEAHNHVPDGIIPEIEEVKMVWTYVESRKSRGHDKYITNDCRWKTRNGDRPKLRWRYLVKEDMARNQMTTEMAEDRKHWRVMIQAEA